MARQDEYQRSGVDYEVLDEVKREAIALAAATAPVLRAAGGREFAESRGSSAYVFEVGRSVLEVQPLMKSSRQRAAVITC